MSAGWRILAPSAPDVLRKPVPVVGPRVVFVLYGSLKMFDLFKKRTNIRNQEVDSPLRSSGEFTTRCPLQGGIPPCNESLRVTSGDIPLRSQSVPMIIAGAICHPRWLKL